MNKLPLPNYNLETTLLGGQAFNWDKKGDSYYGFTSENVIKLTPKKDKLFWQIFPDNKDEEFLRNYLQLNLDYTNILREISKDKNIQNALKVTAFTGILKQDFEQTLLSFILSSHKSIKGIRKLIRDLSRKYGEVVEVEGESYHLFPKTEVLALLSEDDLKKAGTGFRARYLKEAASKLNQRNLEFHKLISSTTNDPIPGLAEGEELEFNFREELLKFTGIGEKIADCVMCFSLGFTEITPLDIWGKRILVELYGVDPSLRYPQMRKIYKDLFGKYTVWAGQVLFEFYRKNK